MISFVLSHDIIITSFYWDLLGLISYLPINFWSVKINCGIKAVLYNKIGDNFSLFLLILFYAFLSFIPYYPELSYSIFLPFAIIRWLIFNSYVLKYLSINSNTNVIFKAIEFMFFTFLNKDCNY